MIFFEKHYDKLLTVSLQLKIHAIKSYTYIYSPNQNIICPLRKRNCLIMISSIRCCVWNWEDPKIQRSSPASHTSWATNFSHQIYREFENVFTITWIGTKQPNNSRNWNLETNINYMCLFACLIGRILCNQVFYMYVVTVVYCIHNVHVSMIKSIFKSFIY